MTTTIIEMPDNLLLNVRTNSFGLQYIQQRTQNFATGFERWSLPTDVRWVMEVQMGNVSDRVYNTFESFYDRVMSASGFFTAFDTAHQYPRGIPTASFAVETFTDGTRFSDGYGFVLDNGGAIIEPVSNEGRSIGTAFPVAGDDTITVSGLVDDEISMRAGDMFSLEVRGIPLLHKVVKDTAPATNGLNVFEIAPKIRAGVLGERLNFIRPRGVFRFGDMQSKRVPNNQSRIKFTAVETPEVLFLPNVEIIKG